MVAFGSITTLNHILDGGQTKIEVHGKGSGLGGDSTRPPRNSAPLRCIV